MLLSDAGHATRQYLDGRPARRALAGGKVLSWVSDGLRRGGSFGVVAVVLAGVDEAGLDAAGHPEEPRVAAPVVATLGLLVDGAGEHFLRATDVAAGVPEEHAVPPHCLAVRRLRGHRLLEVHLRPASQMCAAIIHA